MGGGQGQAGVEGGSTLALAAWITPGSRLLVFLKHMMESFAQSFSGFQGWKYLSDLYFLSITVFLFKYKEYTFRCYINW